MVIPSFAKGIITEEDVVGDGFDWKIRHFSKEQQEELKLLRRRLLNRVRCIQCGFQQNHRFTYVTLIFIDL